MMNVIRKTVRSSQWIPELYNFKSWAYDIINAANSYTPTDGTAVVVRLKIDKAATITKAHMIASDSGTSLTNAYAAIYQDNVLLGQSQNNNIALQSVGGKTFTFSTPLLIKKGYIDVVFWVNGSAMPNFARASQLSGIVDFLTGTDRRYATANTSLTTTAPSTLGTKTGLASAVWAAVA